MHDEDSEDDWAAEAAAEEADRQRKAEPPPDISREEFLAWRSPRTGPGGPVRLDNKLWQWMVRTDHNGFMGNEAFKGPSPFESGPMWCFHRFGKSETLLPDGRVVHVGGEHEDYYDPDFFIYNDVVILHPDGEIAIHGYGRDVFPPTDFHSATRVDKGIFIVGCLGYQEQRVVGFTPVFRLDLDTLNIAPVATCGEGPGWIHRHSASLADDGRTILLSGGEIWRGAERSTWDNIDQWSLDTGTGRWTRLTALDWQRWTMLRVDRKPNRLWDTRQELWRRDHGWPGMESYWRHDEAPDFDALQALYRIDGDAAAPEEGDEHNVLTATVDGVRVRFTEDRWMVQAMVEGKLPPARLDQLKRVTLETLAKLDASEWEIEAE
ncbi:hypothetical protein [Roseateles sp. P5_E1]